MGADEFRPDLSSEPRPTPDPAEIDSIAAILAEGALTLRIRAMVAEIPGDFCGSVEYYFDSPSGAVRGPASGWQTSNVFDVTPVEEGRCYAYRVKYRNAANPSAETWYSASLAVVVCLGDLNGDGYRNVSDFTLFAAAYGSQVGDPNYDPAADLNSDGYVNVSDFTVFASNYGVPCP
jgi:hypothetical protein